MSSFSLATMIRRRLTPRAYTEPETSFRHYLEEYVVETRARGAVPVLVTPIQRNAWGPNERLEDTHGAYPPAVRALAHEEDVLLLDLHAMTERRFETLGPGRTDLLFLHCREGEYPAYPEGKLDNTHLCEAGAREICRMIAKWVAKSDAGLRKYLREDTDLSLLLEVH